MYEITCIKLDANGRAKSGIYNWNWGGGSRSVVMRTNMYSKRIAPLEVVILEL
jgi:hypothetical protein